LEIKNTSQSLGKILVDFMTEVQNLITVGSPTTQSISPASQVLLDALKQRCQALLEE
jgi:hypothetical protein